MTRLITTLAVCLWLATAAVASKHVAYIARRIAGVPVKALVVDLNNEAVKVSAVTARRMGAAESVYSLLSRAQPTAALCGIFFSVRSRVPCGDIVIDGEMRNFGGLGTAICVTPDNQAVFVNAPYGRHVDWSEYELVLGAGMRLLQNGRLALNPRAQHFRDRHVWNRNARTAAGVTANNKLVFVVTRNRVSLRRLAGVMKGLGAMEAVNLDGGGSICLYYGKRLLIHPQRPLTNLIVVYDDRAVYEERRERLGPAVAKK